MRKSFRINTYLRGPRVSVASKEVGGNRSGQQNHISLPANAFSQGLSYAGTMSQERDDLVSPKRKKRQETCRCSNSTKLPGNYYRHPAHPVKDNLLGSRENQCRRHFNRWVASRWRTRESLRQTAACPQSS